MTPNYTEQLITTLSPPPCYNAIAPHPKSPRLDHSPKRCRSDSSFHLEWITTFCYRLKNWDLERQDDSVHRWRWRCWLQPVGVMLFDHPDADFDFEAKCSDRIAQSLFLRKILSPQGSGFASLGFGFYNGGLGLVLSRFWDSSLLFSLFVRRFRNCHPFREFLYRVINLSNE